MIDVLNLVSGNVKLVEPMPVRLPGRSPQKPSLVVVPNRPVKNIVNRMIKMTLLDLDHELRTIAGNGFGCPRQHGQFQPLDVDLHEADVAESTGVDRDDLHRQRFDLLDRLGTGPGSE